MVSNSEGKEATYMNETEPGDRESIKGQAVIYARVSTKEQAEKVGEDLYDAKIRVLGEMVKQHIKEEEEELFPELRPAKIDLEAFGKELAERKEELMSEMQA